MTVLMNHQLATNQYINNLSKKLAEVETERLALRDKLADTKEKLKGSEATLEEV